MRPLHQLSDMTRDRETEVHVEEEGAGTADGWEVETGNGRTQRGLQSCLLEQSVWEMLMLVAQRREKLEQE